VQGREQELNEGINKASKAIALNLLSKGIDIATIAEVTGLAKSVIETFLPHREE